MNILFVEDDVALRYATAREMRVHGHKVFEAGDASEALVHLLGNSVDIVVTDIELPGMQGDVFAAEVRSLRPSMRIVFATGRSHVKDLDPAGGGSRVVHKPYSWEALAAAMEDTPA